MRHVLNGATLAAVVLVVSAISTTAGAGRISDEDWDKCDVVAKKVAAAVGGTVKPPDRNSDGLMIGMQVLVNLPPPQGTEFHLSVSCGVGKFQPKYVRISVAWTLAHPLKAPDAFWRITAKAGTVITNAKETDIYVALRQVSGKENIEFNVGSVRIESSYVNDRYDEGYVIEVLAVKGYVE